MQRPPSRAQTAFLTFSGIFVLLVSLRIPFPLEPFQFLRRQILHADLLAVCNDEVQQDTHLLLVERGASVVQNNVCAGRE